MNLRDELAAEHSKAKTIDLVHQIGSSRKRFEELLQIVCGDERLLAQRGAWIISHCAEAEPLVVQHFLQPLLENLQRPELHDAIKRNTMKAASLLEVPDDIAGLAADLAFGFLLSPDEAVATKVYSMSVLAALCKKEPGLVDEVRFAVESQLPLNDKPAYRSRARQVLRALDAISPL